MIIDASTGEILNAGKTSVSITSSTQEIADLKYSLNIYPNPTSNLSEISFSLEEGNSVKMEVYNSLGSLVYSENAGVLNQGKQRMSFNGSNLNNGLYFINLTIGNEVISKRLILSK
jgi:flagellar hook assembly protein FlgD